MKAMLMCWLRGHSLTDTVDITDTSHGGVTTTRRVSRKCGDCGRDLRRWERRP